MYGRAVIVMQNACGAIRRMSPCIPVICERLRHWIKLAVRMVVPTWAQFIGWSLPGKASYVGAWLGVVALCVGVVPLIAAPSVSVPDNRAERQMECVLHDIDNLQRRFETWLYGQSPEMAPQGQAIRAQALRLQALLAGLPDAALAAYRPTKAMAKYEYLAILSSFVAAINETYQDGPETGQACTIAQAEAVLAETDRVLAVGHEIREHAREGDRECLGLLEIAAEIEGVTQWHAARARSILFGRGLGTLNEAHEAIQRVEGLSAAESSQNRTDPWMERVRREVTSTHAITSASHQEQNP
jgi:hypothetical protein